MESFSTIVNSFQLETVVIELSILVFTKVLASPLLFEFDFLFIQNDVQAFLFTDLLLFAKAKKNGDKLRIIRQPYRLNKIVLHATKDPGAFILVYVNEYGILVTAFTLVVGVNEYTKWKEAIDKAKVRVRLFFSPICTHIYPVCHTITLSPVGIFLFRVSNRIIRTICEICSQLAIKTPIRRH